MSNKFVTLYKYVGNKDNNIIDDIINSHLILSKPESFNDPFDLNIVDKETLKQIKLKNLLILSLTNSYKKKLMWSIYSNNCNGVCFTIEIPYDLVFPVCYTKARAEASKKRNEIVNSNFDKIVKASKKQKTKANIRKDYSSLSMDKQLAYIKDISWNYEKEYRVVLDEKSNRDRIEKQNDLKFLKVKITNVYLGPKLDEEIKEKIIEECNKQNISVKYMNLRNDKYELFVSNGD